MAFFSLLVVLVVLNIIYVIGFLGVQVLMKSTQNYFLGFNPGFATFTLRGIKFNLGLYIPVIGLARIYCVDHEGTKRLFYPWQTFNTSLTKRLFLTYSGVLALIVFGVMLSIVIVYTSKNQYIPKEQVIKYGIYPSQQARSAGFLPGDKIIAINGTDYSDFYELVRPEIFHAEQTTYTILREGRQLVISLSDSSVQRLPMDESFLTINSPFSVGKILPESPADNAGILSGDKILKVNGNPITSFQEMNAYFESDDDGEVVLEILRGNDGQKTFERTVALNEYNRIGIFIAQRIEYKVKEYSFFESFKFGVGRFWNTTIVQFKVLARTLGISGRGKKEALSGPIGIAAAFGSFSFSWYASATSAYIAYIIMLNLLPLPKSAMLEVIPLGYEAVTKKPFSYKSFRRIRQISIVFLVALMIWQFVSDMVKLL